MVMQFVGLTEFLFKNKLNYADALTILHTVVVDRAKTRK